MSKAQGIFIFLLNWKIYIYVIRFLQVFLFDMNIDNPRPKMDQKIRRGNTSRPFSCVHFWKIQEYFRTSCPRNFPVMLFHTARLLPDTLDSSGAWNYLKNTRMHQQIRNIKSWNFNLHTYFIAWASYLKKGVKTEKNISLSPWRCRNGQKQPQMHARPVGGNNQAFTSDSAEEHCLCIVIFFFCLGYRFSKF